MTVHLTLSEFTKVPELELERDEAEQLADASKELAKFYNVSFDPKKVALFNFCLALGKVYVPRAIIIKKRMEKEARPVQLKEVPKQQASEQPKSKVNGAPAPMPFIPPIDPVEMLGGAADME